MLKIEILTDRGERRAHQLEPGTYRVGKSSKADIQIPDPRVSRHHANLIISPVGNYLVDVGSTNGTWRDGRRVSRDGPLKVGDGFRVGHSLLTIAEVEQPAKIVAGSPPSRFHPDPQLIEDSEPTLSDSDLEDPGAESEDQRENHPPNTGQSRVLWDELDEIKADVLSRINEGLTSGQNENPFQLPLPELRKITIDIARDVIKARNVLLPDGAEILFVDDLIEEISSTGPFWTLLKDTEVSAVMINGAELIYVERQGEVERSDVVFSSDSSLIAALNFMLATVGKHLSRDSPIVNARLPNDLQVNAIIAPLSKTGPAVVIRKSTRARFSMPELIAGNTLNAAMAKFLRVCVSQRRNVLICGISGAGKTSLLEALADFIPATERILTVEKQAELRLKQENVIALESPNPYRPASNAVLENALMMHPDRIIVGECGENQAVDLLQLLNNGYHGLLIAGNGGSPEHLLFRLERMVSTSADHVPIHVVRNLLADAIDVIVHITRDTAGKHRIVNIVEVGEIQGERYSLRRIFKFRQERQGAGNQLHGRFRGCNYAPAFYTELERQGIALDHAIFANAPELEQRTSEVA